MKEEKIASIVFMPVCTRCAGFVYGEVDYEEQRLVGNPVRLISPEYCPQCGARFDMIVVPKRFPVEMSKFIQDREKPESDERCCENCAHRLETGIDGWLICNLHGGSMDSDMVCEQFAHGGKHEEEDSAGDDAGCAGDNVERMQTERDGDIQSEAGGGRLQHPAENYGAEHTNRYANDGLSVLRHDDAANLRLCKYSPHK